MQDSEVIRSSSKGGLRIWRATGALIFAVALWTVVTLSDSFVLPLTVPLVIDLPPNRSLTREIPPTVEVTVRANGWSLLKMMGTGENELVIRPRITGDKENQTIPLTRRDLLAGFRTGVTDAQQVGIVPDSLTLTIGTIASKRVPLYSNVELRTRPGFMVIRERSRLVPDTVTLSGSHEALGEINKWETMPVVWQDIHGPIRRRVPVSDSLTGVVETEPTYAELVADVQEIAERRFLDIPIINRGPLRDTNLTLVMQPARITALIRGGADDLSELNPKAVSAYIEVFEGIDTLGVARPRLVLPPGYTVLQLEPKQVRYFWRRVLPKEKATEE